MTMSPYIKNLCKNLYFQLHKIGSIRKYLSFDVSKILITSLILSKLDFCNSLLAGLPKESIHHLQILQNIAAKIITQRRKHDHVTPILKELHWLPIAERIIYKVCLTCYKSINNMSPNYLTNMVTQYLPSRSLRSSIDTTILCKPNIKYKSYGQRSFHYFGPHVWNDIPKTIRESKSVESFKQKLKTYLFNKVYNI